MPMTTPLVNENENDNLARSDRTIVGWQGMRCLLPPDWNVAALSMERDAGYLRIDAPDGAALTVQIRWSRAGASSAPPTLATIAMMQARQRFGRPPPISTAKTDLRANLDRILKETAKQAKKTKTPFETSVKQERTEGENGERAAMNFSWSGGGRGQGKIYHCATCGRIVIAQVVGTMKDQSAIGAVASKLLSTLQCHSEDGYDLWALYDLVVEAPSDFRLQSQKLLAGYLQLSWSRGAEKLLLERWGLANVTLKKFTLDEWFRSHAIVGLRRMTKAERELPVGHSVVTFAGKLPIVARIKALREGKGAMKRVPNRYVGGIWNCPESNKMISLQAITHVSSEGLWDEVARRCECH